MKRASLTAERPTTQHYGALFVEDEWKIGNSLTIRPGVRYEQETLSGTLVKDFSLKNNWAPRVGVVWDPTGTGEAKVFGELRPLLRPCAERSCGPRAVVRRVDHRRLLRCEPDAAGAQRHRSTTNAATGAQRRRTSRCSVRVEM